VLEHIEPGLIDLLEDGIHDYLNLKANLLIGSDSSIPVGFVFTSAPAIHAHCKRVSERTIQRILEHLEEIGWIKTFRAPNQRGNYLTLICRASVHDLSGNEYRINTAKTIDWRNPVYEPVGQVSPETVNAVLKVAGLREVRSKNGELRKTPTPSVSDLPLAEGFEKFYAAYPKKVARADAERAWRQAVKLEEVPAILARLEINKLGEWRGKEKRFIPYPATWLRGRRWQDEIQTGGTSDGKSSVGDRMRATLTAAFGAPKAIM
jgi:hypothetical protein